jgi:hypothetical protein
MQRKNQEWEDRLKELQTSCLRVKRQPELLTPADDEMVTVHQLPGLNHACNIGPVAGLQIPWIILPLENRSCSNTQPNSTASTFFSYIAFSCICYKFACGDLLSPRHAFPFVLPARPCNSTRLKLLLLVYAPLIFH